MKSLSQLLLIAALAALACALLLGNASAQGTWDRSPISPLPPPTDHRGLPPRPLPPAPDAAPACVPGEPQPQAPWMGRYPLAWDGCVYHVDLSHPIAGVGEGLP
jgi:hypothetical protein